MVGSTGAAGSPEAASGAVLRGIQGAASWSRSLWNSLIVKGQEVNSVTPVIITFNVKLCDAGNN